MTKEIVADLVGAAPLLMHNGVLADPTSELAVARARATAKRAKSLADHRHIAAIEHRGGLWLKDGRPCIPAEAIEAALVEAGKTRKLGKLVRAGILVGESPALRYDGPTQVDALFADRRFVHRAGVRVAGRTTMRTRPMFDQWSVTVRVGYLPSLLDEGMVNDLLVIAGERIGIGDWRPRYGRFSVSVAA